ncbi:MAG: ADP-ribosylation factor-like protein [Candidatus Thorarchaeota archaeon]
MSDPDYVFKMIMIGDDGHTKRKVVEQFAFDSFDGEYLKTIGAIIHTFRRVVDDTNVKIVLWEIDCGADFSQLRKAYYQNTSLVILTIENSNRLAFPVFQKMVDDVFAQVGKTPLAILSNQISAQDDIDSINELASNLDASQVIDDLENIDLLEKKMDRLIRESLFIERYTKGTYILSLLRSSGLATVTEIERIIETIRQSDSPAEEMGSISKEAIHDYYQKGGSSIFIDIKELGATEYSVYIPEILEERAREIENIWVNETTSGNYDLRYLWLTAYGFEILRTLKMGLNVDSEKFKRVEEVFGELGFTLQVRSDGKYPDIEMSPELKSFVWKIVSKL